MTDAQRADQSNGIHLCRSDAKLIDDDETMYPVVLLEQWKARQIRSARAAQQHGWREEHICDLISHTTTWLESDPAGIHDHLRAAGMTSAWSSMVTDDIATLLAELALNAHSHAECADITLQTSGQEVRLSYSEAGQPFGRAELETVANGNGGQTYLRYWLETWDAHYLLFSETAENVRTWVIRNRAVAPDEGARCAVVLPRNGRFITTAFEGCEIVQIHLKDRLAFSDMPQLVSRLRDAAEICPVLISSDIRQNLRLLELWFSKHGEDATEISSWEDAILFKSLTR
ncbi:hypothetical protein ACFSYH_09885 [Populibacterium corticicola]|uniref:ATP-binding protein n=1 Tax=Populibacterium corticicola TaxID=1812826 RepID=A0ABW5XFJ2_9MICO